VCGFFISNSNIISEEHSLIIDKFLSFRGPDYQSGVVKVGDWSIYHARLAIIDLDDEANQPIRDSRGGILVFNGEILNYKELGEKYYSIEYFSDSLLLSDLCKDNKLAINELDGFFAFVYINNDGKIEYACRDRFGVKPLYYYEEKGKVSFSSEPAVLKNLFGCGVNQQAIEEYKCLRAPIFASSYFLGVKEVAPGSCYAKGAYFNLEQFLERDYKNISDKELLTALSDGINSRLIADVPVGLLLSRGIDSNLIKNIGEFNKYYSIGFENDEDISFLESKNIEKLVIHKMTAKEYKNDFEYLLKLRGEPLSVPNEVLLFRIALIAKQDGIKVLLSGEGADEFFGGYDRIFSHFANLNQFSLNDFLEYYCYQMPNKSSELYSKFEKIFDSCNLKSPFEIVRWFFIRYHMPILFRRLDFSLMAAGVEGREPIANLHIFDIARKLQKDSLMKNKLGKIPLRKITAAFEGNEFAYEKKIGFPVDLTKVFDNKGNLSSYQLWFDKNLEILR